MGNQPKRYIAEAISTVKTLLATLERDANEIAQLEARVADTTRRADDAERRAALAQQLTDSVTKQADRGAALEDACSDLVDALNRLPAKMQDAAMKQTVVPPDIPLYGTHDWQAVINAKNELAKLL